MSKKTVIMTVCDRCGREERTERPAKCHVTPSESKKSGVTWELCGDCDTALDDFLHIAAPTSHSQNHVSGPSS